MTRYGRWGVVLCVAGLLATAQLKAHAHPISISRASVYLTQERATARIEIFLEDLYLFHQLKPNAADFLEVAVIERGIKLHEQSTREKTKSLILDTIWTPKQQQAF